MNNSLSKLVYFISNFFKKNTESHIWNGFGSDLEWLDNWTEKSIWQLPFTLIFYLIQKQVVMSGQIVFSTFGSRLILVQISKYPNIYSYSLNSAQWSKSSFQSKYILLMECVNAPYFKAKTCKKWWQNLRKTRRLFERFRGKKYGKMSFKMSTNSAIWN